ncbi:hypothetical protein [Devosia alba]|uniref:hypothetical protein n=1 Tax=Devosia alba TaxID=3152360 RepID=UPI0032664866
MMAASKRATAGTVTLLGTALAGGTDINPMEMDLTMNSHITPAPGAATHTVTVAEDRSRPLNPGEPMKFSTSLDRQPVVIRSTTPFFDSCRVLASWGFTGKVQFVDAVTGTPRMSMSIPAGAKLTIEDGPAGPRTRKFRGTDAGETTKDGGKHPAPTQACPELAEAGANG